MVFEENRAASSTVSRAVFSGYCWTKLGEREMRGPPSGTKSQLIVVEHRGERGVFGAQSAGGED
jgi:hypothetical protein